MNHNLKPNADSLCIFSLSAAATLALTIAAAILPAGCKRSPATPVKPAAQPAAFTPEGRWRSRKGMILTVRLLPDGTLKMVDPRGHEHPFRRVSPERWEARISREMEGSIHREGDQLIFRGEPTPEAKKPIAEKKGLVFMRKSVPIEDRMTRVTAP